MRKAINHNIYAYCLIAISAEFVGKFMIKFPGYRFDAIQSYAAG